MKKEKDMKTNKILNAIKNNTAYIVWAIATFALLFHWGALALLASACAYPIVDQIDSKYQHKKNN